VPREDPRNARIGLYILQHVVKARPARLEVRPRPGPPRNHRRQQIERADEHREAALHVEDARCGDASVGFGPAFEVARREDGVVVTEERDPRRARPAQRGVQREAAWLGVPCLVLRDRTEWLEAVETSGGRMVVVGLDAERAAAELDRLAPSSRAARDAAERAAAVELAPAGAAEAISATLAGEHAR